MKHLLSRYLRSALLPVLALVLMPVAAHAQRATPLTGAAAVSGLDDRIAVVVNDGLITSGDIHARLRLALMSSGLPATPEVEQRLLPQIVRGLIDEQLQLQEAKRLDITVPAAEIDKTLARIAEDNHIAGDMRGYIRSHGGSPTALEQQIRAGLAWSKVVQRELRPRVEVGDDEVDSVVERLRANAGKEEFLVSEIFLAVDSLKDEEPVKQVADKLIQQIKGGANFGAVARQFSQGTGAATGGDIGWIQEGQLSSELNRALAGMHAGQVVGPVRSPSGYHILAVRQKRTISANGEAKTLSLDLQQAFRPFANPTERDAVMRNGAALRGAMTSCTGLSAALAKKFPAWHWQNLGTVPTEKVPEWIADKIDAVPVGQAADPIATDKGALVVFVCNRKRAAEEGIDRNAIFSSIGTEKLELHARRLMRDLRRAAAIDMRIPNGG